MPRWEYVQIGVVNSYGIQYRANGEKQAKWKDQPFHVVLNDLGKAGFELVAYDGESYIFKRVTKTTNALNTGSLTTGKLRE